MSEQELKDEVEDSNRENPIEPSSEGSFGGSATVYRPLGGKEENVEYKTFDFRTPIFLTEFEIREMKARYVQYLDYLSSRLALQLKLDCKLDMSEVKTQIYQKFKEEIKGINHICLFSVKDSRGTGIISIDSKLGIGIVNRMLGGTGQVSSEERVLTAIEVSLIEEIVELMLNEWCSVWKRPEKADGMESEIIGYENDVRFLQTAVYDAMMVSVAIKMSIGEYEGVVRLGVPLSILEESLKGISASKSGKKRLEKSKKGQWLSSYSGIAVPVLAQIDISQIKVKEILALHPGDILEMPKELLKETKLRVMDQTCFLGEVGVDGAGVVVAVSKKVIK